MLSLRGHQRRPVLPRPRHLRAIVHYFVSHSWRDNPTEKYKALEQVSRAFEVQNGREPVLWVDKYCIDQSNIKDSLKYLPVWVNASKQRLILHGPSYFTRLWCM